MVKTQCLRLASERKLEPNRNKSTSGSKAQNWSGLRVAGCERRLRASSFHRGNEVRTNWSELRRVGEPISKRVPSEFARWVERIERKTRPTGTSHFYFLVLVSSSIRFFVRSSLLPLPLVNFVRDERNSECCKFREFNCS